MKAVTLWQPWATLIALGLKTFETRSWPARYVGPLAIHAAKRKPRLEEVKAIIACAPHYQDELEQAMFPLHNLPLGAVVCLVRLVRSERTEQLRHLISEREEACGDWSDGRYAWELTDLSLGGCPYELKGAQGLWNYPYP